MDAKEDLLCEEVVTTVLKGLKYYNTLDADSVVNEFLKYAGFGVRNKLRMIMNMIFEKGMYVTILGKP